MAILILLKHGEIQLDPAGSPATHLSPGSCIEAIRMAEAALGAIPEELRVPRPHILCGKEDETAITAALIASLFHIVPVISAALGEAFDRAELCKFASGCHHADRPIIAVSHEQTIHAVVSAFIEMNGPYNGRGELPLARYQGVAIETNAREISIVQAPPFKVNHS